MVRNLTMIFNIDKGKMKSKLCKVYVYFCALLEAFIRIKITKIKEKFNICSLKKT